ncbi:hypothetical protein GCM10027447_35280 [Glycomyces halotolerans]
MLGETIVHGEDIRRPLGLGHAYPIEMLTELAEYYRSTDFVIVAKKRVVDLRLVAEDGPFTVTNSKATASQRSANAATP